MGDWPRLNYHDPFPRGFLPGCTHPRSTNPPLAAGSRLANDRHFGPPSLAALPRPCRCRTDPGCRRAAGTKTGVKMLGFGGGGEV